MRREATTAFVLGLALLGAIPCFAVDGIVVTTRKGTDSLQYYGTIDGELWRHDIKNDAVVSQQKIYAGPASRPAISPDGTKIAFIKKTGSASGKVAMVDIRRYADGGSDTSFTNAAAFNWPPNNGAGDPGDTQHAIFNTGAATNSDRWMCIVTGGARDYKSDAMWLLNWKDQRCIFVTSGLAGPWDHGDFWVGSTGPVPTDPPTITQHPASVSVLEGEGAVLTVAATGPPPLSYQWQRDGRWPARRIDADDHLERE